MFCGRRANTSICINVLYDDSSCGRVDHRTDCGIDFGFTKRLGNFGDVNFVTFDISFSRDTYLKFKSQQLLDSVTVSDKQSHPIFYLNNANVLGKSTSKNALPTSIRSS